MRLTSVERQLFEAACADRGNDAARELLNLFGADKPEDVLILLPTIPLALLVPFRNHLWRAINHEHRKRTGCDLVVVDDAVA